MVRLFFGAAIHRMLSQRLGASLLSLVSLTGSGSKPGAWTASAGPAGKRKGNSLHPGPIFAPSFSREGSRPVPTPGRALTPGETRQEAALQPPPAALKETAKPRQRREDHHQSGHLPTQPRQGLRGGEGPLGMRDRR